MRRRTDGVGIIQGKALGKETRIYRELGDRPQFREAT
jgi:hypothetical protein